MFKKKDIIDNILTDLGEEFAARVEDLDRLVYRNGLNLEDEIIEDRDDKIWRILKEDASVKVWEGGGKVRVKVSSRGRKNISMKKIVDIAVNAILAELKKEE
ncbi:MAG: hypothetical protein JRC91_00730 [Deltaproteobacteria bacterium]|nr:hypothetical protein [Deltaproteobacteria bacterium]